MLLNSHMHVRPYTSADLDALRRIHARQGFDYAFPDLGDPIFISKLVIDDASGRPVCASLARITCEMYLIADPDAGTPPRTLRAYSHFTTQARAICDRAASTTPPPGPRRRSRAASAAASKP